MTITKDDLWVEWNRRCDKPGHWFGSRVKGEAFKSHIIEAAIAHLCDTPERYYYPPMFDGHIRFRFKDGWMA